MRKEMRVEYGVGREMEIYSLFCQRTDRSIDINWSTGFKRSI